MLSTVAVLVVTAPFAAPGPALAQDLKHQVCSDFSGPVWVNPMAPHDSHTMYRLTLTGSELSCPKVLPFAKAFVSQKLSAPPGTQSWQPISGGPPGYTCHAIPDNQGHAYSGHCAKITLDPMAPVFEWSGHQI
jgi:hypothetical protein